MISRRWMTLTVGAAGIAVAQGCATTGRTNGKSAGVDVNRQVLNLSQPRSAEPRHYVMTITRTARRVDGSFLSKAGTRLYLTHAPGTVPGDARAYTCTRMEIERGDDTPVEIESLRGYRYVFVEGVDARNQVFGIDLARFEGLVDAGGRSLNVEEKYWVYNTLIDFHTFANTLTEPGAHPAGIQSLRTVGDRVIHAASHSTPPVHLNEQIEQGSTFSNGEITLTLVGTTMVNGHACALVEVDSGDSALDMKISPAPGMSVRVTGYSRYGGLCAVNLQDRWLERFTGKEMVVTESVITGPNVNRTVPAFTLVEREINALDAQSFAALTGRAP